MNRTEYQVEVITRYLHDWFDDHDQTSEVLVSNVTSATKSTVEQVIKACEGRTFILSDDGVRIARRTEASVSLISRGLSKPWITLSNGPSLYQREHTKEAEDERGEVFTPEALVEEMLGKLPDKFFTSAKPTVLDNSCGNGNFLVKVLEWRLKNHVTHLDALSTIYGIELDDANAKECRMRLSLGKDDKEVWDILNRNIICADALDENHPGWSKVGYMWEPHPSTQFSDYES